jgi:Holliday junction resolvase RusA-like endonuclease
MYDPPTAKNWKGMAQVHVKDQYDGGLLDGPLYVFMRATYSCPKSEWRKTKPRGVRWHTKRGDADNIAKAVLDACTGLLWHDDAQVASLSVEKLIAAQGEPPGIVLCVGQLHQTPLGLPD